MNAPSHSPIPSYAVDLLLAAKWVAHPPVNATPEILAAYQERLNAAVCAFEAQMAVVDGVVLVEHAIVECPAHRAGAEAALSFLRDHEDRAVNLADYLPGELRHHLVGRPARRGGPRLPVRGGCVPVAGNDRPCAEPGDMGRRRGAGRDGGIEIRARAMRWRNSDLRNQLLFGTKKFACHILRKNKGIRVNLLYSQKILTGQRVTCELTSRQ
jgi:hypothetical protein